MKFTKTAFKYLPLGMTSSVLAFTLIASPAALARQGSDEVRNVNAVSTNTSTTETETNDQNSSGASNTTENEQETDNSVRSQARSLLQAERQKGKEHTAAQRQQACEAHKAELATREANYATAAQRHLDTFNSIFTKVQAFHDSKQLTVANYDTLVATAKTKQAAAQSAVDELKALNVTIDCTQPDPASSVATLKAAVQKARGALQDYRAAIKDLIVALQGASTSTSTNGTDSKTSSTGGNQ